MNIFYFQRLLLTVKIFPSMSKSWQYDQILNFVIQFSTSMDSFFFAYSKMFLLISQCCTRSSFLEEIQCDPDTSSFLWFYALDLLIFLQLDVCIYAHNRAQTLFSYCTGISIPAMPVLSVYYPPGLFPRRVRATHSVVFTALRLPSLRDSPPIS